MASALRWVNATLDMTTVNSNDATKCLSVHRAETGISKNCFWLGQSIDGTKALMVKENQPGALGKIAKAHKVWTNEGSKIRGEHWYMLLNIS